jgi:hypothetical protein
MTTSLAMILRGVSMATTDSLQPTSSVLSEAESVDQFHYESSIEIWVIGLALQNCKKKMTISFVMSFHLSDRPFVRTEQLSSHRTNFMTFEI